MSSPDPRIRQYKKEEATIRKLVFVLLLLLLLLGFYLLYSYFERRATPEPLLAQEDDVQGVLAIAETTTTPQTTTTPASFPVHIAGAVKNPGVYYVTEQAILNDLLNEAGGFGDLADKDKVNLAMSLVAHQYVYIPQVGEEDVPLPVTPVGGNTGQAESNGPTKVNINTADEAELTTLSGVGPATAQKIIAYREANGPFQALEDLMNVPGIKEGRFAGLKDFITLE